MVRPQTYRDFITTCETCIWVHSKIRNNLHLLNWVSDLIQDNPRRWNDDLLKECFDDESIAHIHKIQLGQFPQADKVIWSPSNNGAFSTKSAFWTDQVSWFNTMGPLTKQEWNMLWKLKIHDRLKLLLWKIIWNALPTREVIGLRLELDFLQCPLCGSSTESLKHLFLECPISRIAWSFSPWSIRFDTNHFSSIVDWVKFILNPSLGLGIQKFDQPKFILYAVILYDIIWKKKK